MELAPGSSGRSEGLDRKRSLGWKPVVFFFVSFLFGFLVSLKNGFCFFCFVFAVLLFFSLQCIERKELGWISIKECQLWFAVLYGVLVVLQSSQVPLYGACSINQMPKSWFAPTSAFSYGDTKVTKPTSMVLRIFFQLCAWAVLPNDPAAKACGATSDGKRLVVAQLLNSGSYLIFRAVLWSQSIS